MNVNKFIIHSAIATLLKTISAFIIIKIIASEIGPKGLGEISNTFSLVAFATIFSIAGIGSGIIKYVAKADKIEEIYSIIRVSLIINIAITAILISLSLYYGVELSEIFYTNTSYKDVFLIISILFFPLGITVISLAVLSGIRRIDLISRFQLFGLISGSILISHLTLNYGLKGVVLGLFLVPIIPIFYVLHLLRKNFKNINVFLRFNSIDIYYIKKLAPYSWITIIGVLVNNGILLYFRAEIEKNFGSVEVGNWQAMIRISDGYSQIFMVFLMSYLLPNIARSKNTKEIINNTNKTIIYTFVGIILFFPIISVFKNQIIQITLSNEFNEISLLFNAQLISDFFRIMSYVPALILLGLGKVKLSVFMEIIQGALLFIVGKILISENGSIGAVNSYLIAYILYFIFVYAGYILYNIRSRSANE